MANNTRHKKRWRTFKWVVLLMIPILAGGLIFAQRLVKKRLIAELNNQLNVKVMLHSVDISGFSDFPNIGVRFNNLRVEQSAEYFDGYLLKARNITVVVNAMDLIRGRNTVKKLEISDGEMQLYEGLVGNNFSIFKESTDTSQSADSESEFSIDLKKVNLRNMRLIYESRKTKQNVNCFIDHCKARLKYGDDKVSAAVQGYTIFDHYEAEGTEYLLGKKIEMDFDVELNQRINSYHVHKGNLVVDGLPLQLEGSMLVRKNVPDLDLAFESSNADIQGLLALLPAEMALPLRDWNTGGELSIKGSVNGQFSAAKFPLINVKFGVEKGNLRNEKLDVTLGRLDLDGELSNGKNASLDALKLNLNIHQFSTEKSKVKGSVKVKSFAKPNTDFALSGELYLSDLDPVLGDFDIRHGKVKLNTSGKLVWSSALQTFDYNQSQFFGDVSVSGLDMKVDDYVLKDIEATGKLSGRWIKNTTIKGAVQGSEFAFEGNVKDWQAGVLGSGDRRAKISGKLDVQAFDLNAYMADNESSAEEGSNAVASSQWDGGRMLDIGWDASLDITAKSFKYDEMRFSNIKGHALLLRNGIYIDRLNLEGMDGKARIKTQFEQEDDKIIWSGNFYLENLKIDEFFRQFENFGQTEITDQHLSGRLTTETDLYVLFDHEWIVITDEIIVLSKLNVKDGELKGYKPLESLSAFVEVEDLKHIQFSEMKNVIRIEDETIFIPTMSIENNALNLELSGTHTFENELDYKLKLSLTEILAKKSGWIKTRKQKQLESGSGGAMNAYILLSGTPDDLDIKFDRKAVKEKIREEAKAERKQFFKNLKKEIRGERVEEEEEEDDESPWDEG